MSVRLVWITPESEKLVAYIARVSNPQGQSDGRGVDSDRNANGLIKYLIRNKHWSPFEMVSMCVEINTTRAISPQILRHRSFSFQEFSQRYATVEKLSDDKFELRRQDLKNRQNSIDDLDTFLTQEERDEIDSANKIADEACKNAYTKMLNYGVAKECARNILPLNTPTRIYMSGTLRSWIHYVQLRSCSKSGTQKEHAIIAELIKNILMEQVPTIYTAAFAI